MDIASAYQAVWSFTPPRKCREVHAAGLAAHGALNLAFFEFYSADEIAEGDAFVSEMLIPGLVPIGGDSTGDRWCFDARLRVGGTIPIAFCPHDGGGASYVAPSFAGFLYRLVLENLMYWEFYGRRGVDRAALRSLTLDNLRKLEPWLLHRWARRGREIASMDAWPTDDDFDAVMRQDRAFSRLPAGEFDHFR
ncbi:MAG: SMI1/KNR4 family protein [Polyangiaceae bacterium]